MANGQRGGIKPFGTGRIILWRGGSIWIGNAGEATDFHAFQLTLALSGGEVRFRSSGENWKAYKAAIITAHQSHAFEARGELVALIFAEPESREGRAIKERYSTCITLLPADTFHHETAALAAAFNDGAADAELITSARAVISRLSSAHALPAKPLDKRIERAITVLRERLGPDCSGSFGIGCLGCANREYRRHRYQHVRSPAARSGDCGADHAGRGMTMKYRLAALRN
jgi:hypothetical protein